MKVVDTFTKNAGYVSASSVSGSWTCSSKTKETVTCTLAGTLLRNASATVQVVLKPTAKGSMTNTACETANPGDAQDCDTVALTVLPS